MLSFKIDGDEQVKMQVPLSPKGGLAPSGALPAVRMTYDEVIKDDYYRFYFIKAFLC